MIPVTADGPEFADEVLFFIHGWPDDLTMWDSQVRHMTHRGYRCLRVTMPHFAGRDRATELGDRVDAAPDWGAAAHMLAESILKSAGGQQVTLVIHDWGCIWGFLVQLLHPELVKAIVAMDVGTPDMFDARVASVPKMILVGLSYQYWLATAHLLGRAAAAAGFGHAVGDWMARAFARLPAVKGALNKHGSDPANLTGGRITSDACYPYFVTHRNFLLELLGAKPPVLPATVRQRRAAAGPRRNPDCPLLFFYGKRKPVKFHDDAWEHALRQREDCHVERVDAGHWLSTEQPDVVNEKMAEWLDATLPGLRGGDGPRAAL